MYEMLEICIQISYDQNVQLILKSYLPVVYGTPLIFRKKNSRIADAMKDYEQIKFYLKCMVLP
jgi:hypothetical protein